jgi:hypothetical protein
MILLFHASQVTQLFSHWSGLSSSPLTLLQSRSNNLDEKPLTKEHNTALIGETYGNSAYVSYGRSGCKITGSFPLKKM